MEGNNRKPVGKPEEWTEFPPNFIEGAASVVAYLLERRKSKQITQVG